MEAVIATVSSWQKRKNGSCKRSHKLLAVFLSCPYSAFSRKICKQRFIDFMIPYRLLQSKSQYLKQNFLYSQLEHTTWLTKSLDKKNRRRLRTNSQFVFWQLTQNAVSWTIIERLVLFPYFLSSRTCRVAWGRMLDPKYFYPISKRSSLVAIFSSLKKRFNHFLGTFW